MIARLLLALAACLALLAAPARADDNRPFTLTVEPVAGDRFELTWKIPPNLDAAVLPALSMPQGCTVQGQPRAWSDALGHWQSRVWACPQGLAGRAITITWPRGNPGLATIARVHQAPGVVATVLLQPGERVLPIPAAQGPDARASNPFMEFLRLGMEHIATGWDHLLFVAGLIVIAGTWRRVLVTVTGFTLAHSLTLALSALDLVRLHGRAVEVAIALSIVFLAVEIARGRRDTLTWRYPVAVAATFGLLHGFGFANVLREVGLPPQGLASALLAFNLGIELGQVAFAASLLGAWRLAARLAPVAARKARLQRLAAYGLGITASFWLFERLASA